MKRKVIVEGEGEFEFEGKSIKDCAEEAVASLFNNEPIVMNAFVIEEDGTEWNIPVRVEQMYTATNLRQGMKDE
jgi:hypothetical protein